MRTVSQNLIDAITTSRKVSANAIFRDTRLRFTYVDRQSNDDELNDQAGGEAYLVKAYDSCVSGTGILRVANVNGTLKYMWVSAPPTWPGSWTSTGISLKTGSGVGVHSSRCFYQKTDGKIYYKDWSGGSFGGENVFDSTVYDPCGIAPVSTTSVFLMEKKDDNYAKLCLTVGGSVNNFEGRIYDISPTTSLFDAEHLDGVSHVFFATEDGKRPWMITYTSGNWSQVTPVIPLDVVDDDTSFRMCGVELINGQIVFSGVRTSASADGWLFYSFGPSWTMGRDCFIGKTGAVIRQYNGHGVPVWGGKMHLIGSTVYVAGPSVFYTADATFLLGVDNASYKRDMADAIRKLSISFRENEAAKATFEIAAGVTHQAIRVGSDVDLSVSVGGYSAIISKFNVDAIVNAMEVDGQTKTVVASSKGLKNVTKWAPDLNYDMWGQGKASANPATLTDLIRVNGDWEVENNAITLMSLNERGIMYSSVRPSRNAIVQGRFKYTQEAANHNVEFGLLLNYYRETKEQAMARLGKSESEIVWWDYGENGLAVVWGTNVHSGGPGFGLYWFYDGSWFKLSSYTWSASLTEDTWYWIQAEFFEGNIRILYRADSATTWTLVSNSYVFESSTELPWSHYYTGRAGLYMHNITPNSTVPIFNREVMLIPVMNNGTLPENETYIADSEQMICTTKSINRTGPGLIARTGYTLAGATHTNPYTGPFVGNEIYCQGTTAVTDHDYWDNLSLVVTGGQGMGQSYKITDWDYVAPNQWVPSQTYTLPDTWLDHIGQGGHGSWVTDPTLRRIFVEEDAEGDTGDDSTFTIVPNILSTTRGANDTTAVGHSNGARLHVYKPNSIFCDRFRVFTGEIDMSISDIYYELNRRAGNLEVDLDYHWSGSQPGDGDNLDATYADGVYQSDFVCKMRRVTASAEIGVVFYMHDQEFTLEGTAMRGDVVTVTDTAAKYYHITGFEDEEYFELAESVPIDNNPLTSWVTFSVDKGKYSVWINNRLVASFVNENYLEAADFQEWSIDKIRANFYCPAGSNVDVRWPEIAGRVDNFIMDMGKGGATMISRLIGDKHIYYCDNQSGVPRLFREGDTIPGSFALSVFGGNTNDEQGIVTRSRVEGFEAYEVADEAAMKEHGNVFRVANNEDVNSAAEAAREAHYIIDLGGKQIDGISAKGAGDPRVEPGDTMTIVLPDGSHSVWVETVIYSVDIDRRSAMFDMTVEGY